MAYNFEYIQLYFTDCQQDVFILQRPKSLNFALNIYRELSIENEQGSLFLFYGTEPNGEAI